VNLPTGATAVFSSPEPMSRAELGARIEESYLIPVDVQRLTSLGGRTLVSTHQAISRCEDSNEGTDHEVLLEHGQTVSCVLSLCGGKGGFGSMLRSQGAKMKAKTAPNFGSCRDLSGRRLKAVDDARL